MEILGVALVVVMAILVGVAIPALVQLRATLRAMENTIERSGARFHETLGATAAAVERIDSLVVRLEQGGRIEQFLESVAAVNRMVTQLRDTVRVASAVGAAVGPAVAAAVHAFREDREESSTGPLQAVGVDSREVQPESRKQAVP